MNYLFFCRKGFLAVTVAAAVNTTVILFNKCNVSTILKNLSMVSGALVSAATASYVSMLVINKYNEQQTESTISNNIKILQNFCNLVETIMYDINEVGNSTRDSSVSNQ